MSTRSKATAAKMTAATADQTSSDDSTVAGQVETTEQSPQDTAGRVEGTPATDSATEDESSFTRQFVVSLKGIPQTADLEGESFHNANKIATLQDAINGGFRATGDVSVLKSDVEGEGRGRRLRVTYSVPVIRATKDERVSGEVPSPRSVINEDMNGSTLTERPEQLS